MAEKCRRFSTFISNLHIYMHLLVFFSYLGITLYLTENTDTVNYKDQSRRDIINISTFSCKMCPFLQEKGNVSTNLMKASKQNFTKTFSLVYLLYHADKPTDGRTKRHHEVSSRLWQLVCERT
jgi:hypothetical protein